MAESEPLRKSQKLIIDSSDVAAVVQQQLMQQSKIEEDNNCEKSKDESTSTRAMIEEIFGKEAEEQEETYRPKKRRYRSLDSLYQATKPVRIDVCRWEEAEKLLKKNGGGLL